MSSVEQKIIVVCDFTERMNEVIVHGIKLASFLRIELCLFATYPNKSEKATLQEKLIDMTYYVKQQIDSLVVSSLILKGSMLENVNVVSDKYNAVLVVLHRQMHRSGLKALRESHIPFLFVEGILPENLDYKQVVLPLDIRKASKETALWASYFGKYNRAEISVLLASEKQPEEQKLMSKNTDFIKLFFKNTQVDYRLESGRSSSWGILSEGLERAKTAQAGLLIFAGSTYVSLLDKLIGLPEQKILKKAGTLPVLIINPRRELYVMCESCH
jgi:hypothetical protein